MAEEVSQTSKRTVCTNMLRPCITERVGVFIPDKRLACAVHLQSSKKREQERGSLQLLWEKGEAHLLLEMGKQDFSYIFLTVFCTVALKLSCVSSMSVAGLGYVVTAAVVLSAVVSDLTSQLNIEKLLFFYYL